MARKPKRCLTVGCTTGAVNGFRHCKKHGGGKRCLNPGCTKSARGKTEHCMKHGGGNRCQTAGCNNSARDKSDHCIGHGGGRRCKTEGCTKGAEGKTDHCIGHGGGRRCQTEGCMTGAEGKTDHCIKHGGGRRCHTEGCTKSAQGKTDHCVEHGGGRRCHTEGCTRGAGGKTDHCKKHGGGHRCVVCSEVSVHVRGGACYKCRSGTSLKKWEAFTTRWLHKLGWPWSYNDETLPCARAMTVRDQSCIKRPDYVFVFDTHAVILEVDENYHRYYEVSCEAARIGKMKDLVKLPLHFVRFNPAKRRYPLLKDLLELFFKDPEGAQNAAGVLVHFVSYPQDRIEELSSDDDFCYEYKSC